MIQNKNLIAIACCLWNLLACDNDRNTAEIRICTESNREMHTQVEQLMRLAILQHLQRLKALLVV